MSKDQPDRRFVTETGADSAREARRYVYGVLVTALERDLGQRDGIVRGGLGQTDERLAIRATRALIEDFKRKAGA